MRLSKGFAAREGELASSHNHQMAEILHMLWPEPCVIGGSRNARVGADSVAYVAIPNWDSPVVIAPRRPRRVMAATIRGYNTAARGRSRAKAQLTSFAATTGATDVLFPIVWIDDSAADGSSSIRKYLADVLDQPVSLSISVGPRRAVQKPVLQIVGRRGEILAFAKVGQNALTRSLVEREARNLRHLETRLKSGSGVEVPTLRGAGTWRDTSVLVQSALARGRAPAQEQFATAMRSVCSMNGVRQNPLVTSAYWTGLRRRIDELPETAAASALRSAVTAIDARRPSVEMSFGSWHGDLTPWNVTATADKVRIWDWEHYGDNVPVGFDALHYEIQNLIANKQVPSNDAVAAVSRSCRSNLAPLDVRGPAAQWTAFLYLMEIATRYVEDVEQDGATEFGHLEWLEPNLQAQLVSLSGSGW